MTTVNWKGVGNIEFPDEMPREEIDQILSDREFYFDDRFGLPTNPGLLDVLPTAAERGFRRTATGLFAARSMMPDVPLIGMSDEEAATAIREQQIRMDDIPMSAETRQVLNDVMSQDVGGAIKTLVANPGATASIITEGLGGSLPAAAATIGAVAVPALFGAALTTLGVAAVGGTAAGLSSFGTEYSNSLIDSVLETMQENGTDVTDVEDVAAALADEDIMEEARESAIARGVPIGLVDAATFALGGVFGNALRAARQASRTGVEVGADGIKIGSGRGQELAGLTAMETAGGVGGEALAQISDEGAVRRPGELVIEGLASGAIGGPINLMSYMTADMAARRQAGIKETAAPADPGDDSGGYTGDIDLDAINTAVVSEGSPSVTNTQQMRSRMSDKLSKMEERLAAREKEAEDLQYAGLNPQKLRNLRDRVIPKLRADINALKSGQEQVAGVDITVMDDGTTMFGESLDAPRLPGTTKSGSLRGVISDIFSRSTAAVERTAQNPENPYAPVITDMLNSAKTFFHQAKLLKGQRMYTLNEIVQPFQKSFKVPVIGGLKAGSESRGYDGPSMRALGEALHSKNLDQQTLKEILDRNNVSPEYREVFPEVVGRARTMLDDMLASEQAAGVQVEAIQGYFPLDMAPLFRGVGSKARRAKAVKTVAPVVGGEDKARKIFEDMEQVFLEGQMQTSNLDHLYTKARVRQQGFQKERTLLPEMRDALTKADILPKDFYEVMRRRIGQHAIAIPTASRIEPIRKKIASIRDANPEEAAALQHLMKVTHAVEGTYGTGGKSLSRGARALLQPIVTAMYLITLGMAGVASAGEVMVLAAHARPGDALHGLGKMGHVMSRKLIRSMKPDFKKSEVEKAFEKFLIYASAPEMAERFTSQSVVDFSSTVTEKFFLLNLLTQITQATRIVAAEAFTRAVDRDTAVLASADPSSKEYRQARLRMRKLGVPDKQLGNMTPQMRQMAILNGIDQTVMTPDPTNRPLWMSNPYLAPVAMLKSFATTFGNTIGKMVWDEIVVGKTQQGDQLTVQERASRAARYAIMMSLLMGMQLGIETFRDSIRNWDGEDRDYDESDQFDLFMEAGKNTMIFGLYTPILDALNAHQYGASPMVSLGGPVVGKIDKLMTAVGQATSTGEIKLLVREFVKSIPFVAVNPGARRRLEEALLDLLT